MTYEIITAARRRTRRRLGLAVGAVAAVAVLGWVAGLHLTGKHPGPDPADPPSVDVAAVAGLPADIGWVRVAGVDLPVSASAGPADTQRGRARRFARTPDGAVIAALHLLVRTTPYVGPAVFVPTLHEQVAGPDAPTLLAVVTNDYRRLAREVGAPRDAPIGPLPARFTGYAVTTVDVHTIGVDVLTTTPTPDGAVHAVASVELTWINGDWALVAPPAGRWDSQIGLVSPDELDRFTVFASGR
jgi:hypothetical protein